MVKEKGERVEEVEFQLQKLERANESLQKKVTGLSNTCEKVWILSSLHYTFLVTTSVDLLILGHLMMAMHVVQRCIIMGSHIVFTGER